MENDQDRPSKQNNALSEYRKLFQDRLNAAKLRKGAAPPPDEHPWVRSARLAKSGTKDETDEPDQYTLDKEDRDLRFGVMIMTLSMVASLALGLWVYRGIRPATPSVLRPEQAITVWHDAKQEELVELQAWATEYAKRFGTEVKLLVQTNLPTTLVQAAATSHGPSVAVVSQDLALRLFQGGVLRPLNSAPDPSQTSDLNPGSSISFDGYYLPLTQERPWTRTQVLVVPRSTTTSAQARQFTTFVKEHISLPDSGIAR